MKNLNKQIIRYGLLVFLGLTSYFLLMEAIGLVHNFNLRIFNAVILFSGIFLFLRKFGKQKHNRPFSYLNGLGSGLFVTIIGVGAFALFMAIYLLINPDFMVQVRETEPQGIYLNVPAIVMLILIEGLASGILFTYTSMQYMKSKTALQGIMVYDKKKRLDYESD